MILHSYSLVFSETYCHSLTSRLRTKYKRSHTTAQVCENSTGGIQVLTLDSLLQENYEIALKLIITG